MNGLETLMIVNSCSASPTAWTLPVVPTTQMPNSLLGTRASAGYTFEFSPSVLDLKRLCASATSARTRSGGGKWPVDT